MWAGLLLAFTCLGLSNGLAQAIITTYAGGPVVVNGAQAVTQNIIGPVGVASDNSGGFYFTTSEGVYRVASDGTLTVISGDGVAGFSGDGGPATSARLSDPRGVAVDGMGNLFIADSGNNRIRKITSAGIISTVAGTGMPVLNGDGGPATSARLSDPRGVAVDGIGNLFIADTNNNRVRKVTPDGTISTVAGDGIRGFSGDGGLATSARLSDPGGVAVDGMGNLFIADAGNNSIRKVTPDGTITTVAQSGFPQGVAVDTAGNVFVADYSNFRIRKVDLNGVITTVAGNGPGFVGDGGLATAARLNYPTGVAVDGTGNLLIGDTYHGRIRRVGVDGKIDTIAGNGEHSLAYPTGVAVDSSGNLFIIDTCSDSVLKVSPGGVISTLGSAGQWYFCDFEGFLPVSPALDQEGTLFVPSVKDHKIQKITSSGIISTVVAGFGPFITPPLYPTGVAVDHAGNLFFADQDNHRVRKVTPTGNISIVAGAGLGGGFFGDGGPATSAFLRLPTAVAVDRAGNLFIADSGNARIRKVAPDGIISTVAGNGRFDFSGDGGVATAASFGHVNGIALDAEGNLFISDSDNNRIRKITFFPRPAPVLTLISPDLTSPGAATEVTLNGTDFAIPFTINTSSDITVDHIRVINDKTATATLAIASNATLGPHPITVTTAFGTSSAATLTVVPPFPDLKVTVSPNGRLAVGFNGVYTVDVRNVGTLPFPGPMTLTDTLPAGLSYVSGTGSGWSCSAAEQAVTCGNSEPLDAGASSRLTLTVAVGAAAANGVTHTVSVEAAGDLVASNNIASDVTVVTNPSPRLVLPPTSPGAGQQATMGIALPESLPYDVTGTVTLRFVSEATNPIDDPAIQFASGGRQVTFVIPANTLEARFATNTQSGPLLFQTGTVAGTFAFEGMLETGTINIPFSSTLKIPRQAPEIRGMQTSMTGGFVASVTLWSTAREVTDLVLQFDTTTNVRLSCGSIANRLCTASGSSLTLNVKEHFDNWYNSDTVFGSLATLRFPLSIQGTVQGTVRVTLRNSMGSSSSVSFQLP